MREALRGALLSVLFFALLIGPTGVVFADDDNLPSCHSVERGWCRDGGEGQGTALVAASLSQRCTRCCPGQG